MEWFLFLDKLYIAIGDQNLVYRYLKKLTKSTIFQYLYFYSKYYKVQCINRYLAPKIKITFFDQYAAKSS